MMVYDDPLAKLESLLLDWEDSFQESRQRLRQRLQNAKERLEVAWASVDETTAASDEPASTAPAGFAEGAPEVASQRAEDHQARLESSLQRAYQTIAAMQQERTTLLLRVEELTQQQTKSGAASSGSGALETELLDVTAERDALRIVAAEVQAEQAAAEGVLRQELAYLRTELERLKEQQRKADPRSPQPTEEALDHALGHARRELELERERFENTLRALREEHQRTAEDLGKRLSDALRDRDEAHQEIVQLRSEAQNRRSRTVFVPSATVPPHEQPPYDLQEDAGRRLRLGQILERAGIVSQRQLDEALEIKKHTPEKPLGAILVALGVTEEDTIAKALASQLNLPYVELDRRAIDPAAAALIPAKLARHHGCIPLALERGLLVVAMANPLDLIALEDLELATRRRVDPVIATPAAIQTALDQHYANP
jgi:hypothetical protein